MDKPRPRYYPYLWLPVCIVGAYFLGGPLLMIPGGIMLYEFLKPEAGIFRRVQLVRRMTPILRIALTAVALEILKLVLILPLFFGGGM